MSHVHLIAYRANDGTMGVAHVDTDRRRPSWQECREQIPGFMTGGDLGPAPLYTLRYATERGPVERELPFPSVQKIGTLVMRMAERGKAWNVQVLDSARGDITFNFPCFCV